MFLILAVGMAFGVYLVSQKPAVTTGDLAKTPSEVKEQPNFVDDGTITQHDVGLEDPALEFLYEEPGFPALIVALKLNNRSTCDFGNGEQVCGMKHFEDGMRAHVEGLKSGNDVTVVSLKILPQ